MGERGEKLKEELIQLNKEEKEIIRGFNTLKLGNKMLNLLLDEYDVSWSREDRVIFKKEDKDSSCKRCSKRDV